VKCDTTSNTLILKSGHEDEQVLCIMNFSKESQQVNINQFKNSWKLLLDSADPKWKGPLAGKEFLIEITNITIQPESILIYTNHV
jgi:maltooligosyltrehalose trehalohydrolase